MRNPIQFLAILVLLASIMAACGASQPTPTTAPTEAPTVAPTETPTEVPTAAPTATATHTPKPASAGIEGSYGLLGTYPDGSNYKGSVVVKVNGNVSTWAWNDGKDSGVGLQQENVVSVARGGDACIIVSYLVGADGVLNGIWTDMKVSGMGTDVATPTENKPAGLEGLYNITGKNPDGSDYACSLQVTKTDKVYEWYWFNCGEFTGVGVQDDNVVTVTYGADTCGAVSYRVAADGTLNGTWAVVGKTEIGQEVLTPK